MDERIEAESNGFQNQLAVCSGVGERLLGAVWNEVSNDWKNEPEAVVARMCGSAAIGLGTTVLLRRSPMTAAYVLGIAGLGAATCTGLKAHSLLSSAWDASSDAQRTDVINRETQSLAKTSALLLETAPGMVLGSAAGYVATPRIAVLENAASFVARNSEWLVRQKSPNFINWVGPGVEYLPATLRTEAGNIDALALGKQLADRHPWQGVEVARQVRLSDMKASRALPGVETEVGYGFAGKGHVDFHTHPPGWAVPSTPDIECLVGDVGVLTDGARITFYKPDGSQRIRNNLVFSSLYTPLKAVVVDPEKSLAVEVIGHWEGSGAYPLHTRRFLDYDATVKTLSNWDRSWASLEKLPTGRLQPYNLYPASEQTFYLSKELPGKLASQVPSYVELMHSDAPAMAAGLCSVPGGGVPSNHRLVMAHAVRGTSEYLSGEAGNAYANYLQMRFGAPPWFEPLPGERPTKSVQIPVDDSLHTIRRIFGN